MPGVPSFDNPFTYLGVLIAVVGFYLILSGFGILTIPSFSASKGVKSWGTGLFLFLLGFAILFFLIPYSNRTPGGDSVQEISLMNCAKNPNKGFANTDQPIALTWGWSAYSDSDRQRLFQISSHIVEVDGRALDISKATHVFSMKGESYMVMWTLSIGKLGPGIHEVRLIRILSEPFTDTDGTTPAGAQEPEICKLIVSAK